MYWPVACGGCEGNPGPHGAVRSPLCPKPAPAREHTGLFAPPHRLWGDVGLPDPVAVGVLIFVQVRFLPYHSDWVTVAPDLDVVDLSWSATLLRNLSLRPARAWPRCSSRSSTDHSRPNCARCADCKPDGPLHAPMAWRGLGAQGSRSKAVTLLFSWTLATIPENPGGAWRKWRSAMPSARWRTRMLRRPDGTVPSPAYETCRPTWKFWSYFTPVSLSPAVAGGPVRTVLCLSYLLFEAPTTPLNMRRNLQVRSVDLVPAPPRDVVTQELDPDQAWREHGLGLDLRGRDLRYADLSSSDLRKADLRGADLLAPTWPLPTSAMPERAMSS